MSATACTQPGCTGAILDGYCDVCGSPGPAQALSTSASSVGGVSGRCTQPGCSGTVVDGYCDICGSPGPKGSGSQSAPGGTGSTATGTPPASARPWTPA